MALSRRKTKIVVTLGPASRSRETIRALIEAGMNVARLNFSHGTHDEHTEVLRVVREESESLGRPVAVFQDLCGPKVRIGELRGGAITLEAGQTISLRYADGSIGDAETLYVEAFDPVNVIQPNEKVLLADGLIEVVATRIERDRVLCSVRSGGLLRSRSGLAVPDSHLSLPCLTEKDLSDLAWGVVHRVDFVALSFVSSPKDILFLREKMFELGTVIPVIAKIERARSLDHLDQIMELSDAVMIARGDLGLELPLERVPSAQRFIVEAANLRGTPVITATQMLQSMTQAARPSRAEVTDVCTAVRDGTDAVMLSEETAIGNHPVLVVQVLDRILIEAESEVRRDGGRLKLRGADQETVADAICFAACGAATKVAASAIVACTQSGYTARLIAKYRPTTMIFGATTEHDTFIRMSLYWGINPVLIKQLSDDSSTEDEVTRAMAAVRDQYGLKPGSRVVITAGLRAKKAGSTTLMEIREIPRTF